MTEFIGRYRRVKPLEERAVGSGRKRTVYADKSYEHLTPEEKKEMDERSLRSLYCRTYYQLNRELLRTRARERYRRKVKRY